MLTIAEIAKELDIPATTAREYVSRFKEYFPTKRVAGKRWEMYLDTAKITLADVVEGYKQGLSSDEIRQELSVKYTPFIDADDKHLQRGKTDNNQITTTPTSLDLVAQMQLAQMQVLHDQSELIKEQSELIRKQTEALGEMLSLIKDLREGESGIKRPNTHKSKKNASKPVVQPRRTAKTGDSKQQPAQEKKQPKGLFGRLFGQ